MTRNDYYTALDALDAAAPALATVLRSIPKVTIGPPLDTADPNTPPSPGEEPPPPVPPGMCGTVSISARELRINPAWWDRLVMGDRVFVLAHDAWHILQRHEKRKRYCPPVSEDVWDAALDISANCLAEQCGIRRVLLKRGCFAEDFGFPPDLSVEHYVRLIREKYGDSPGAPPMDGHPPAGEDTEEGQTVTADGIAESAMAGLGPGDTVRRVYDEALGGGSGRDWRAVLRDMLTDRAAGGRSFARPPRRWDGEGVILPSDRKPVLPRVAFVIDFSGSMREIIALFADDVIAIAKGLTGGRHMIIGCSNYVTCAFADGEKGTPKTARQLLAHYTGGGTDMSPAFALARERGCAQIICLTDLDVPAFNLTETGVVWVWRNKDQKDMRAIWIKTINPKARHIYVP